MINRISKTKVLEIYTKYEGRFTVMAFDRVYNKRIITITNLGLYRAFGEYYNRMSHNQIAHIFVDLPEELLLPKSWSYKLEKYIWEPDRVFTI